jgi:hypothetical protein
MQIDIRRTLAWTDVKHVEAGRRHDLPLVRATCGLVVANPHAGRYVDDLAGMIAASGALGEALAAMVADAMRGHGIESYGKGGVVGLAGELEHVNALLTTVFADPVRRAVGGGLAWIPSFTKRAAAGASIDVPLAHKDALYVRSHYDGVSVTLPPETPDPDEIVILVAVANRGRLNARVGGLAADAIAARDGLR